MTVRPPRNIGNKDDRDPLTAALEQEILNEKASTLSRLTVKLEQALSDLKTAESTAELSQEERDRLVAAAGEALWHVVIQRELCGLRQHKAFNDFLAVPSEVRLRMGPARLAGKNSQ
ncbi:DUF6665 family protein [Labrenzia sp. OB1]|uniref:DUF6665 family protein n=1 Tax=Labrenzia sp. OB1 TaxID=1561204 RepID=UPI0007B25B1A|nr:DUF6665 family protein [Labrenzia sp. OB1]KZM49667.1 hypothetical protein OA90_14535 [Labrenzia sp. OB1]